MVRIEGLKLAPGQDEQLLRGKAARLLRVPEADILSLQVLRRAIDAREELHFVYTAAVTLRQEKAALRRIRDRRVTPYTPELYRLPETLAAPETPPVVIGAGPGGLFAALVLARCGLRPIVLERGQDAVTRQRDVTSFWRTGVLDPESNVQFGEGGAGAFSDGKLNTGTRDRRHRWILEQLVSCGAPESILVDAKPHVGTDMLHVTLVNLRRQLLSQRIRELRVAQGYSQVTLAKRLGVSKQAVSNWENDNIQPSIEMLLRLAQLFSVSTDYLLGRETSLCADLSGLSEEAAGHVLLLIDDLRRAADLRNT